MVSNRFISIEGIEGAGKSSVIEGLCTYLEQRKQKVVRTREPGGSTVGEAIRRLLLTPELPAMHVDTELLLMFAARAEHIHKVIRPALHRGEWVVCDRFTDASYAYQGGGRGIAADRIRMLEDWVQSGLRPDLTLLLDIDPGTGMLRVQSRGSEDRIEQEDLTFFDKVRQAYLQMAINEPERFCTIDASGTPDQVDVQVRCIIDKCFGEN
jgi:dTMP kinase